MLAPWNMIAGWVAVILGMTTGAAIGLGFHRADFGGGYDSWRRRLARLGHISFFGLGLLNIAFALSLDALVDGPVDATRRLWLDFASISWIVSLVTMPTVCFLSAWRPLFRHAFFVPVLSAMTGTLVFLAQEVASWISV